MSISIIVPTFNRARLLTRAIESVLNQTHNDWELIIIDDGSTDNTDQVVADFLSDRIKYFRQDNAGANRARNYGATLAKHEYLSFLDSDDELSPEWLEEFSKAMVDDPDIVCCGTIRIEPTKKIIVLPESLGRIFGNQVGKFTNGACYVIKSLVFAQVGGFDEELLSSQHTELSMRLASRIRDGQFRIVSIYKSLVKIHIHDGPRIRTNDKSKYFGAQRLLTKHFKLLSSDPILVVLYARIIVSLALKNRRYLSALRYFFVYIRFRIISKLKINSSGHEE